MRAQAFQLELETIRTMLEEQEITRDQARRMRDNVHLMQSEIAYTRD